MIELNKKYKTKDGSEVVLVADSRVWFPQMIDYGFPYAGLLRTEHGSILMRFYNNDGKNLSVEGYDIPMITKVGVGKYTTVTGKKAVITAEETASSGFPLIGYVDDGSGHLAVERWNHSGRSAWSNQHVIDMNSPS